MAREIRLVNQKGEQLGIMSVSEALQQSQAAGLDLVEISPNATPPVCRIMDFSRHLFDEKKRKNEQKKKQHVTQVKEIKFRPTTEEADYQVKLRKILGFLKRGDRVKISMRFRGREMQFRDVGAKLLERLKLDVQDVANVERDLELEGRQFFMLFTAKKR